MPRKIRLTFTAEGVSAIAELLEEAAPQTCEAVWNALPASGEVHHAIYSGSEGVLILPEAVRVGKENATSDVKPGDVGFAWIRPGDSWVVEKEFAEICWFYDRDGSPRMPEGPFAVNLFARITEGAEAFFAVTRRMRREGMKRMEAAREKE